MVFIYILQLISNKYYIGKTTNPTFRLDSHFNSNGSEWTKLYKPIELLELIPDCDPYDEDKYTLKYMASKGIDNVRGGSFIQIKLTDDQINFISNMIKGATDKCFECGESDHFAKDCIKIKVHKLISGINNEDLESNINNFNIMYDKIIKLKKLIEQTDFISKKDIPKIKKICIAKKKYDKPDACLLNKIHGIYKGIVRDDKLSENKEPIILAMRIIDFNLDKKSQLKHYENEDYIKEVLEQLYQRKIDLY